MQEPTTALPAGMAPPAYRPFQVTPGMGTPRDTSADAIVANGQPSTEGTMAPSAPVVAGLAGHVRKCFEEAKQHLEQSGVAEQIIAAKRARDLQYSPTKLAQIRAIEGPDYDPPYDPIIDVKCRALEAWLSDIILSHGNRPWSIEPTPIPDLPEEVTQVVETMAEQRMAEQVAQEYEQQAQQAAQNGQPIPPPPSVDDVRARTEQILPEMKTMFVAEMKRRAREACDKMTAKIEDQLAEGGWRQAIKELLYDFCTYPACFLKGPILVKEARLKQQFNAQTRKWTTAVVVKKIDTWKRVPPDKIYPEPHSTSINGGYLIELSAYKRKDLYNSIGIEGYSETSIREVLREHKNGGLKIWTLNENEKARIEKKSEYIVGNDIDVIIFWGPISGQLLIDWGINENAEIVADAEREYEACVELIGTTVIMARLNPDPLGQKPYYKTSLIEDPDRFWNKAVPDILKDISALCGAVLRACGVNAAFAAGPMVDINVERMKDQNDTSVYPRRKFLSTNKQMSESKAVNFYQPQLLTTQLSSFLEFCHTLADEWVNVPRITHGGDTSGSGVTSTASGTSMFITQSSRGVKASAKNVDGVIEGSVTKQYQVNLWEDEKNEFGGPYLDAKIVARGSSSLMAKEQQAVRRQEFTTQLLPEEKQLLGMEGLKGILQEKLKALEMDVDKLLPDDRNLIQDMTGMKIPGGQPQLPSPQGKPEALSAAGDMSGGRDFSLFQPGAQAGVQA